MFITYQLTKDDILTVQLFNCAQSERINKRKRKAQLFLSFAYLGVAILRYLHKDIELASVWASVAIIFFLFYPQ